MQLRQPSSAWLRCEFARHLLCQTAAPRRAWPAGLCSKATLVTGAAGVRLAALASRAEAGATNLSDPSYSYGAAKITDKLLPLDSVPPRSPAPPTAARLFCIPRAAVLLAGTENPSRSCVHKVYVCTDYAFNRV